MFFYILMINRKFAEINLNKDEEIIYLVIINGIYILR